MLFRSDWRASYLVMMATMAIDLDHLLAVPIYDPGRCSVGFHPLHSPAAIAAYVALTLPARTRLVGLGLVIHIALDSLDCMATSGVWYVTNRW